MAFIVPDDVEDYASRMTPELGPVFDQIREVTEAETELPQMQVGRVEGTFLGMLVHLVDAKCVLEVGTFTGYSALAMACALPEDGELITLDIDEATTAIAKRLWAEHPAGARIRSILGDARQTMASLTGPFDLVFIDADKTGYESYYDAALPMLRPGGLIVLDNMLWSGSVLKAEAGEEVDEDTRALHDLNVKIRDDQRVESVLLTVRDGMHVARKR